MAEECVRDCGSNYDSQAGRPVKQANARFASVVNVHRKEAEKDLRGPTSGGPSHANQQQTQNDGLAAHEAQTLPELSNVRRSVLARISNELQLGKSNP